MDNLLNFSDAKQVRKTLLILSFIAISLDYMTPYFVGPIKFLGFEFPIENIGVVSRLIGFLLIYYVIALLIRYADEIVKEGVNERAKDQQDLATLAVTIKDLEADLEEFRRNNGNLLGVDDGITDQHKQKEDFIKRLKRLDDNLLRPQGPRWHVAGKMLLDFYFPLIFGLVTIIKVFFF